MDQLSLLQSISPAEPVIALSQLPMHERPICRVAADSSACNAAELLATLIGGPRQIEVAHHLLARFSSLHGIACASLADLTNVNGIGEVAAARIKSAMEISRRLLAPEDQRKQISSPTDAAAILQPILMHREQEYLYVLLLDTRNRVIGEPVELYHGSLNTSLIRVGEVFRDAIKANAASIVIAHNHPSADPSPSPEDVALTRAIVEAGKLLDIALLDHLVIGRPSFVSLKERGLGFDK